MTDTEVVAPSQAVFRTRFSEDIFKHKYAHERAETWEELSKTLVEDVCRDDISREEKQDIIEMHSNMEFIAGGRYLYYAGRDKKFFNNCFLLKSEEDTREDWANLSWKAQSCLMTGGGIGNDYSVYRPKGSRLGSTGGVASGAISSMKMINEIGRYVMQGGSRRSAIYASLNWQHGDVDDFMVAKNWYDMKVGNTSIGSLKEKDFNFPAPLDMTNISINYDNAFLEEVYQLPIEEIRIRHASGLDLEVKCVPEIFRQNVHQALSTGEPGFSFNFFEKEKETLRNAPVSADTWILTNEGYVQIKDVIDTEIIVWTGKRYAKTTFKKTAELSDIINVGITGGRLIKADPNHEFLVERYEGKGDGRKLVSIDRVPAKYLEIGDILHTSMPKPTHVDFSDRDYILGYAYGDGSFNKCGADITLCADEPKECLEHICQSLLNKSVFPADMYSNVSFIAGLFDSGGCYLRERDTVRLSSIHYEFLEGVRRSLDSIGIMSIITTSGNTTYSNKQCYSLVVMQSSVLRFKEVIPTIRLKPDGRASYEESKYQVKETSVGTPEDVYCCDVKVEEHSFMADGVIISNCTEVTSEDDSDVCNLGSVNMSRIETKERFREVVRAASRFLLLGTLRADLPYEKVYETRAKNRRLGLGIMGVHEWLLKRGYRYEVVPELHEWLQIYKEESELAATELAFALGISTPVAFRAIAPTGTIGILAGTTTGIEPLFAVAYQRRYLKGDTEWHYQYVIDGAAEILIDKYKLDPSEIESALDLAKDPERRIKFQADVQDYVDMSISSTINLPKWGSSLNKEDKVDDFAKTLLKYAHRLRGFTCYPDGARGGQPLKSVSYKEAKAHQGVEFKEEFHDICDITGHGGSCGV